jgi:signal peptidase I
MRPDRHTPDSAPTRRSPRRRAVELAALLVLGAVLFVTWPQPLGGRVAYIMVSGHSMEPTLHLGDLAVIRADSSYHVGEIIAYRVPNGQVGAGVTVIHRIVGGNPQTGFITRGDNNHYDDPWHHHPTEIVGARWALIPGAANALSRLRGPLPLAAFAALLTILAAHELFKQRDRPEPHPHAPEPEPATTFVALQRHECASNHSRPRQDDP